MDGRFDEELKYYLKIENTGSKGKMRNEEEWEFIASAKGQYGWGHHPYTQNTVVEPKEFSWDNIKYDLPNITVDYVNTNERDTDVLHTKTSHGHVRQRSPDSCF